MHTWGAHIYKQAKDKYTQNKVNKSSKKITILGTRKQVNRERLSARPDALSPKPGGMMEEEN